jgi:hypothetical protein
VEFWFDFGRLQYKLIIRYITEPYWMPPSLAGGKREQITTPPRGQVAFQNCFNILLILWFFLTAFPPRFCRLTIQGLEGSSLYTTQVLSMFWISSHRFQNSNYLCIWWEIYCVIWTVNHYTFMERTPSICLLFFLFSLPYFAELYRTTAFLFIIPSSSSYPSSLLLLHEFSFLRPHLLEPRDRAVGIATGFELDDLEVGVRVRSRIFTSPCRPDRLRGPPNFLYNGYRCSFPVVKRPGREAGNSPPAGAEVKKMWIYASTPPYVFMA